MNIELVTRPAAIKEETPIIGYDSDEDLFFERMNCRNLEDFMLLWHLNYYAHLWNVPPPPNYIPIVRGR
jgi:hypothetical protein